MHCCQERKKKDAGLRSRSMAETPESGAWHVLTGPDFWTAWERFNGLAQDRGEQLTAAVRAAATYPFLGYLGQLLGTAAINHPGPTRCFFRFWKQCIVPSAVNAGLLVWYVRLTGNKADPESGRRIDEHRMGRGRHGQGGRHERSSNRKSGRAHAKGKFHYARPDRGVPAFGPGTTGEASGPHPL